MCKVLLLQSCLHQSLLSSVSLSSVLQNRNAFTLINDAKAHYSPALRFFHVSHCDLNSWKFLYFKLFLPSPIERLVTHVKAQSHNVSTKSVTIHLKSSLLEI